MKKIFESQWNSWDETAEKIHVYEMESDQEYWDFEDMSYEEKCQYFNVFDQSGYYVRPGAEYYTYAFDYTTHHVVMYERCALNV